MQCKMDNKSKENGLNTEIKGADANKQKPNFSCNKTTELCVRIKKIPPPDGDWGWLVVAAVFLASTMSMLNRSAFYVLYVEWVDCFQSDKGLVGGIGSLCNASGTILGVVFGALIDMYGCRTLASFGVLFVVIGTFSSAFVTSVYTLFFTYGTICGIGLGINSMCALVIVQQYFNKNRALASGIASMGVSVGNMTRPPIAQLLMDHYGWRGALIIISGITMHLFIITSVYRPLQIVMRNKDGNSKIFPGSISGFSKFFKRVTEKIADLSIFKNIPFSMCVVGSILSGLSILGFTSHLTSHAVFYGIDRQRAALINTISSVVVLTCRTPISFLANMKCSNRILMYGLGSLFTGVGITFYSMAVSYPLMIAVISCIAVFSSFFWTVSGTMLVDIVGIERYPKAMALDTMFFSFGSLIGTPFLGYLFTISCGYHIPVIVAGSIAILGGVINTLTFFVHKRLQRKKTLTEGEECHSMSDKFSKGT